MADDKKKAPPKKSAPPAAAPTSKTGHQVFFEIIIFVVVLLVLAGIISGSALLQTFNSSPSNQTSSQSNGTTTVSQADYGFWGNILNRYQLKSIPSSGNLVLNKTALDKGLTQVRRDPGGSVIGLQQRGAKALLVDGPVAAYGTNWFMANYDNVPSGWVDENDLTTEYFWYYVVNFLPITWGYFKILSWILSVFFVLVIIFVIIKEPTVPGYDEENDDQNILQKEVKPELTPLVATQHTTAADIIVDDKKEPSEKDIRWNRVGLLMKSHNLSDWKQAIIESDVILEDMLEKMGYHGNSIGEKLKDAEKNDFETLDKAWEAHKVRNRIAHDGSSYKISYEEVARVVGLYGDVFKEFYWV